MTGRKTHEQQRRIIERRENTRNADPDFDPRPDLKRSDAGAPPPPPAGGRHAELEDPDSYPPPRGTHQESEHHKRPADQ